MIAFIPVRTNQLSPGNRLDFDLDTIQLDKKFYQPLLASDVKNQSGDSQMMRFLEHIKFTRKQFDRLKTGSRSQTCLAIVLGNEGSDLDSFISLLSWSYYKKLERESRTSKWEVVSRVKSSLCKDPKIHFPVNCTTRDLFSLRGDCQFVCQRFDISDAQLIFVGELETMLETLVSRGNRIQLQIVLVDQPILPVMFKRWLMQNPAIGFQVSAILDHHKADLSVQEYASKQLYQKSIVCGSNCTNICEEYCWLLRTNSKFLSNIRTYFPPELVIMLLSTILLDTSNLDIGSGKVTKHDTDMVSWLMGLLVNGGPEMAGSLVNKFGVESIYLLQEKTISEEFRTTLYREVHDSKVGILTREIPPSVMLMVDFKFYELQAKRTYLYGISSIMVSLDRLSATVLNADGNSNSSPVALEKLLLEHCRTNSLEFCGVLARYVDNGQCKREFCLLYPLSLFHATSHHQCMQLLGEKLVSTARMELMDNYLYCSEEHVLVGFKVLDTTFSRKKIQPLLHDRLARLL